MVRLEPEDAAHVIPFVLQNLRSTYGIPENDLSGDPLDVLIRTILSQSTTRANSSRAFASLKERFPVWDKARRARVASIEKSIRSGGLATQKALRIKSMLEEIYKRRGSLDLSFLCSAPLEEAVNFLKSFKGVGPKTVACTLLFACDRPTFPVDVHIFRIARRLGLLPATCSDEEAHEIMESLIPSSRYFEAHINIIKHGRTICRPRNPKCESCSLVDYCDYYRLRDSPGHI